MKSTVLNLLVSSLALVIGACGASEQGAEQPAAQEESTGQAMLDMDPPPAIDGFSRWDTECPFPFSFQHPEDWSHGELDDQNVSLTTSEDGRFGIGVYGRMGEDAAARWKQTMSGELATVGTVEVGGEEVDVLATEEGSGYWVIAPFNREPVEPPPGMEPTGATVTHVAVLDVSRSENVAQDVVMEILDSLEPNGCELR